MRCRRPRCRRVSPLAALQSHAVCLRAGHVRACSSSPAMCRPRSLQHAGSLRRAPPARLRRATHRLPAAGAMWKPCTRVVEGIAALSSCELIPCTLAELIEWFIDQCSHTSGCEQLFHMVPDAARALHRNSSARLLRGGGAPLRRPVPSTAESRTARIGAAPVSQRPLRAMPFSDTQRVRSTGTRSSSQAAVAGQQQGRPAEAIAPQTPEVQAVLQAQRGSTSSGFGTTDQRRNIAGRCSSTSAQLPPSFPAPRRRTTHGGDGWPVTTRQQRFPPTSGCWPSRVMWRRSRCGFGGQIRPRQST